MPPPVPMRISLSRSVERLSLTSFSLKHERHMRQTGRVGTQSHSENGIAGVTGNSDWFRVRLLILEGGAAEAVDVVACSL